MPPGQVKDADEHLSVRDLKKRSRAEAGTTTSSVVRPAPSVSKSDVLAEVVFGLQRRLLGTRALTERHTFTSDRI